MPLGIAHTADVYEQHMPYLHHANRKYRHQLARAILRSKRRRYFAVIYSNHHVWDLLSLMLYVSHLMLAKHQFLDARDGGAMPWRLTYVKLFKGMFETKPPWVCTSYI